MYTYLNGRISLILLAALILLTRETRLILRTSKQTVKLVIVEGEEEKHGQTKSCLLYCLVLYDSPLSGTTNLDVLWSPVDMACYGY